MRIVIVGGVAGGASAAARLRRLSEDVEIIMFERGEYISFANCGLPYHIGKTIKERENLLVQTVEGMKSRFNIDVRIKTEIIAIDSEKKNLTAKDLTTQSTYEVAYDRLILSPGAEPSRPPIPGIESSRILTLRNMADMDEIITVLQHTQAQRAVVIGAGFIGMEIAENLHDRGLSVTVVEKLPQVLAPVDEEIAAQVHQHFKQYHIGLYLADGVTRFHEQHGTVEVYLESGSILTADIIILAIGVRPETSLAVKAGLEIGKTRGIVVDEYLETSVKDIFAVGDAIEVKNWITGKEALIPLAWPANRQGRIVADNILTEHKKPYKGSLGTSIIKVFDLTVSATGLNEKVLKANGYVFGKDYFVVTINRNNHAGYYPGAVPFTLKLIFDKSGKILGAQGIGYDGVDKRIDVIATGIKAGMDIYSLQDLELAYAPPYNSAKDPVNIAGYAAENILNGDVAIVRWYELEELAEKADTVFLDVRTIDEFELGFIPGAMHIDVDNLRSSLEKLDKKNHYIVYCQVGLRGYIAARVLKQHGFNVSNLDGGYKLWLPMFLPQENRGEGNELPAKKQIQCVSKEGVDFATDFIEIDACGMQCPGPILKTKKAMDSLSEGELIRIKATDPGFMKDVKVWAEKTGNSVVSVGIENNVVIADLRKGASQLKHLPVEEKNKQTIVVFSGDFDKALASFIIADGALAMGKEVSLFFTFWGLNILRKHQRVHLKKSFIERMFGKMMPRGINKLALSKMNMGGLGTSMMKKVMKKKHVDSLDSLMNTFLEGGGKIIACTMSMDVMGIRKEELIDGIEFGGVASYLGDAQESYSNLFI